MLFIQVNKKIARLFGYFISKTNNYDMKSKRRELTTEEKEESKRLQKAWDDNKKRFGLTQDIAADKLKYKSQGAVSHYLTGKIPLNIQAIIDFSKLLEISPSDIRPGLKDIGFSDKAIDKGVIENSKINENTVNYGTRKNELVPLISYVQAGAWCRAIDNYIPGDAEMWLPCPSTHGPHTYALRVRGDSMTGPYIGMKTYPDGSIIYVDPEKEITNGCRVIAKLIDIDEVTFKEYREDAGKRLLKPLNPQYPIQEITENVIICGVIVGQYIFE